MMAAYVTIDSLIGLKGHHCAWPTLDALQRQVGGVRGYGGPGHNGHWLRLRLSPRRLREELETFIHNENNSNQPVA